MVNRQSLSLVAMTIASLVQKTASILKLVRWPNLVIIILVQLSLYHVVINKIYGMVGIKGALSNVDLAILVVITVLITAAGYVINDYFDLKTDKVNKPGMMILGKSLPHRYGIAIHMVLNGIAFCLGVYLSWRVGSWRLMFVFPMIMMLLWLYSVKYKKTVIWGNLAVAFMSAMVILIVWLFEFFMLRQYPDSFIAVSPMLGLVTRYFGFYAIFAFLISLIREIVKDVEDIEGDRNAGCKTLAVVHGVKMAKGIALGFTMITIIIIGFLVFGFINNEKIIPGIYFAVAVMLPLVYCMVKLITASEKNEFHLLSNMLKMVMVAGIIGLQPISIGL